MAEGTQKIILAALLVFALAGFLWPLAAGIYVEQQDRRRRGEPPEFDERQALARLRAGVHALFALLGYLSAWAALDLTGRFAWTKEIVPVILCGGIWSLMVWAADCILHDAWAGWSQRKQNIQGTLFFIWGFHFTIFQSPLQLRAGNTVPGVIYVLLGAGFFALAGVSAYAAHRRKLAEEAE